MIGVNPPGHFLWDAKTTDEQIRRYAALCAKDDSLPQPHRRPRRLDASGRPRTSPTAGCFLPIKQGNVRIASFFGLMDSTSEAAPISAPMTLDSWLSAEQGDASGFWFLSLLADLAFPTSFVWGEVAAAGRPTPQAARALLRVGRATARLDPRQPRHRASSGPAAAWPTRGPRTRRQPVRPRADLEGRDAADRRHARLRDAAAERDRRSSCRTSRTATRSCCRARAHDRLLEQQPRPSNRLINTFFDTGKVDDSLTSRRRSTSRPSHADGARARASPARWSASRSSTCSRCCWMARRVHTRGRFGRKAARSLRSLYPIVLGLGGWFLGVADRADDDARPCRSTTSCWPRLSVGLPIGLGVDWAWVHGARRADQGDRASRRPSAGALVGAWLGSTRRPAARARHHDRRAAAGGNLTLLGLDIAGDRRLRDRFPANASETLRARPATG